MICPIKAQEGRTKCAIDCENEDEERKGNIGIECGNKTCQKSMDQCEILIARIKN